MSTHETRADLSSHTNPSVDAISTEAMSQGQNHTLSQEDVEKTLEPSLEPPPMSKWRLSGLVISLLTGLFLSLLDTSIVATALFSIGNEFKSLDSVNWVALAYTLTYLGFAVLFARLSDVVGRRHAEIGAFIIFIGFSLGCGFARDLNQLIAFRALQGIGGSGLYSLTMIILPEYYSIQQSKMVGSYIGLVIAMAGVMGPVVGGVITHETTWRWVFWINAPIGIIALALFIVSWQPPAKVHRSERNSIVTLDFVGAVLLVAASVLVVFAFQEAGLSKSSNVWRQGIFIGPIVAGGVCWILLIPWEMFIAKSSKVVPLLPPRLLRKRLYTASTSCTITIGFVYFVVIYSLPIHFQTVYGKSALVAGISLLPLLGSAAVGSIVGGIVCNIKRARFPSIMFSSAILAIGAGLLSTVSRHTAEPKIYGFQVLIGFGFGLSVTNISVLATRESERRDVAVAQGIVAQARVLGGSIAIAASSAILGVTQRRELRDIPSDMLSSLETASHLLTEQQLKMVQQAYIDSFVETMRVTAIVAAVGCLFALGVYERQENPQSDEKLPPEVVES